MRGAFITRLTELAELDPNVLLLTGDLGFGVLDEFATRFPRQFLNVGVAEQNMSAVATGLALDGYTVFTYSIGNFPTLRCLEQLRNDAFYHEANVNVVSVGGGFSYGALGMSHHATEDLSVMRALPGVTVCVPGGRFETAAAVTALANSPGPSYLRLERAAAESAEVESPAFELGKARVLREGNDVALVACGGVVAEALAAAERLSEAGIECRILSMHSLKPLDTGSLDAAASETGGILTIEENNVLGGLGGAVAEHCLESTQRPRRFKRLGIPDTYMSVVGDQAYLRRRVGVDCSGICETVRRLLAIL